MGIESITEFEAVPRPIPVPVMPDNEPDAQLKDHVEYEDGDGLPDDATPAESGEVWPMARRENAKRVTMSRRIPMFRR